MEHLTRVPSKLKLRDCEIGVLEMLGLQEIETYPLTNECPPRVSPIQ